MSEFKHGDELAARRAPKLQPQAAPKVVDSQPIDWVMRLAARNLDANVDLIAEKTGHKSSWPVNHQLRPRFEFHTFDGDAEPYGHISATGTRHKFAVGVTNNVAKIMLDSGLAQAPDEAANLAALYATAFGVAHVKSSSLREIGAAVFDEALWLRTQETITMRAAKPFRFAAGILQLTTGQVLQHPRELPEAGIISAHEASFHNPHDRMSVIRSIQYP